MQKLFSLLSIALAGAMALPARASYPDFTTAAENSINGVVSIKSYATPRTAADAGAYEQYGFGDPFLDYFFGGGQRRRMQPRQQETPREQQLGLGSGVILSADGYLVTNNHVIQNAERLEITLNDNRTFNATIVGNDPATDLALLKIDATDLPVIPMGNSDDLKIGEWVLAVGNPFGFTSTVTAGIVSAKARSLSGGMRNMQMSIESYIQTDAAVNPGNSGGALVNTAGELVGINTAIYSQTGNYAGYSFAIPASIVTKVVADIKEYGTVQRAVLGIMFRELTPALAKERNITSSNDGIIVEEVVERSAAFEAGLKPGDVVVEISGQPVHTTAQLQEQMARLRPGDKITISFMRGNERLTATATLRNASGTVAVSRAGDFAELGCAFKALDPDELRTLGLKSGVKVAGLTDGKFRDAGIRDGFIILHINGSRIRTVDDIEKIYEQTANESTGYHKVLFISGLYPTGKKKYYAVDLDE